MTPARLAKLVDSITLFVPLFLISFTIVISVLAYSSASPQSADLLEPALQPWKILRLLTLYGYIALLAWVRHYEHKHSVHVPMSMRRYFGSIVASLFSYVLAGIFVDLVFIVTIYLSLI